MQKLKARLNELEPDVGDEIDTPDVVLTVQISQALNNRHSKLAWSEDFLVLGIILLLYFIFLCIYWNKGFNRPKMTQNPMKKCFSPTIKI